MVGRQADSDVQFDPHQDLEVSGRHAEIFVENGEWIVRDLDSRNGTYVNGRKVREHRLRDGDRITFGWKGPETEFRATGAPAAAAAPATRSVATDVSGSDVYAQNRQLRRISTILAIGLIAAIGIVLVQRARGGDWQEERASLLERIDSALATGDSAASRLAGEREGLMSALRESQQEVMRVRRDVQSAGPGDGAVVDGLRRQVQTAMAALERQQLAASLDYEGIERRARHAVARIWVEYGDGSIATGSAFAVRTDATLITSGHVITGSTAGSRPRRIAVQFSDSDQIWPARVLAVDDDADVAAIRIDNIVGDVPVVPSLNMRDDTLRAGAPVAMIGFPLGGATWPGEKDSRMADPLTTAGVIRDVTADQIEIQGYGAAGASGSPVFDATGAVVAVVFGGRREASGQILITVPASAVNRLLEALR